MVSGGTPATTYITSGSGYMNVGDLRFNTNTQNLEVYDGQIWRELNTSHASVGLTPDAEMALEQKAKDNPAIADLLKQRNTIDEKIKVIEILTKDNTVGTN